MKNSKILSGCSTDRTLEHFHLELRSDYKNVYKIKYIKPELKNEIFALKHFWGYILKITVSLFPIIKYCVLYPSSVPVKLKNCCHFLHWKYNLALKTKPKLKRKYWHWKFRKIEGIYLLFVCILMNYISNYIFLMTLYFQIYNINVLAS